jgi:hypothetical protein
MQVAGDAELRVVLSNRGDDREVGMNVHKPK